MVLYNPWDNGRKAAARSQYDRPTLEEICEVAKRLFPGISPRELVLTAEVNNDGRSIDASVVLTPR